MCRNITMLRGLEPAATAEEIEAAARQYVRKVSGVQNRSAHTDEAFERAVDQVTAATTELLAQLPARRQPPPTLPPLRRLAHRAEVGAPHSATAHKSAGGHNSAGARNSAGAHNSAGADNSD